MTSEGLQHVSQLVTAIGLVLAAAGGYGAYHFGRLVERANVERAQIDQRAAAARQAMTGAIEPATSVVLDPSQDVFPVLELGDSGARFVAKSPAGAPLFRFVGENSITIVRDSHQVKLSAVIRDSTGAILAEIVNNEWKVNHGRVLDRNYSADTVEVRGSHGEIVLQVRVLSDRVQLQAKSFTESGVGIAFGVAPQRGGVIVTGGRGTPADFTIKPMFRYPSDNHLGELATRPAPNSARSDLH